MPYFSLSVTPLSSALGFHNEVNWTDKLPYIYDTHATSVFSPGAIHFQHEEHLLEFNSAGMLADFFFWRHLFGVLLFFEGNLLNMQL